MGILQRAVVELEIGAAARVFHVDYYQLRRTYSCCVACRLLLR
jgi:hypothetical protein